MEKALQRSREEAGEASREEGRRQSKALSSKIGEAPDELATDDEEEVAESEENHFGASTIIVRKMLKVPQLVPQFVPSPYFCGSQKHLIKVGQFIYLCGLL
ncbi:unnamed protein product [Cuscuta epithymum]|uniref:Uncharacterized protein n=1 Tax=Cuscuta epithymum TaxID=186058 RepID=A0AAV0DWC9_9ASTE|nr:unnamed protein product [Cuscuta epithymum]